MKGIAHWKSAPVLLGTVSFAAILLVWESVVRLGWVNPFFISQPSAIAASLSRTAQSGELWRNLSVSLREFAIGYGASVAVGILAGALAGRFRTVEYALDPFLWFLYSAPLIAFYPIFVLWFGLGVPTVIVITFLLSVTQIATSTLRGFQNVNPGLLRAARSFGATERDVLWKVILPASVPMVIAGLRLGIGRALMGVVVGELFWRHGGPGIQHRLLRRLAENHGYDRFFGSDRRSGRSVHAGAECARSAVRFVENRPGLISPPATTANHHH